MEKKNLLVLAIVLFLASMVVGVAFAEDGHQEYEYKVEVYYTDKPSGTLKSAVYTLWASSADEATKMATARCDRQYGNVASCGGAIATGRSR